jgi:hypothetical protein
LKQQAQQPQEQQPQQPQLRPQPPRRHSEANKRISAPNLGGDNNNPTSKLIRQGMHSRQLLDNITAINDNFIAPKKEPKKKMAE